MKQLNFLGATLAAVLLAGCEQTLDERFEQMCVEKQARGGQWAQGSKNLCENGEYLSPEDRQAAVEGWERIKEAEAKLKEFE